MSQRPPFLKEGDKVIIISTARRVSISEVQPAISQLTSWGLEVSNGNYLFEESNQFAGSDQQRILGLQEALDDPEIKAIFCARGGYGTSRIIDDIEWNEFIRHPKWVIGFSDVTTLLLQIQKKGISSLHGPMVLFFSKVEYQISTATLKQFLFGKLQSINCKSHTFNNHGTVEGTLIGGNLSLIINNIGTQSAIDPTGKILFLEDVDEYLYHIDRMMVQLKRTGVLSSILGLIVGYFSDMKDNTIPFGKNAYEIIKEHVQDQSYPVAFNFPVGHEPDNLPMPIGNYSKLIVSNECVKLEFS